MFNLNQPFNLPPKPQFSFVDFSDALKDNDFKKHVYSTFPRILAEINDKTVQQQSAALSLLEQSFNSDVNGSFYSEQIIRLYKQEFFKNTLESPSCTTEEVESMLFEYFIKTEVRPRYDKNQFGYSTEERNALVRRFPFLYPKTNADIKFGIPLKNKDGKQESYLDIVSIGWHRMPQEFYRISFHSDIQLSQENPAELGTKIKMLCKKVAPLLQDAIVNKKPFFGKFTSSITSYFCDYVHKDMVYEQLEVLMSKQGKTPKDVRDSAHNAAPENLSRYEIPIFGDSSILLRVTHEAADNKQEQFDQLLELVKNYPDL
jgi:hypothetical protein